MTHEQEFEGGFPDARTLRNGVFTCERVMDFAFVGKLDLGGL
jgi:hypothetical protein